MDGNRERDEKKSQTSKVGVTKTEELKNNAKMTGIEPGTAVTSAMHDAPKSPRLFSY